MNKEELVRGLWTLEKVALFLSLFSSLLLSLSSHPLPANQKHVQAWMHNQEQGWYVGEPDMLE